MSGPGFPQQTAQKRLTGIGTPERRQADATKSNEHLSESFAAISSSSAMRSIADTNGSSASLC
jgi:hypothetical protein